MPISRTAIARIFPITSARDYAQALEAYYGGKQKAMAERLEVSETWLSRYLQLAKLPAEIIAAYGNLRELKELHARLLKPFLGDAEAKARILAEARNLAAKQKTAPIAAAQVLARLKAAGEGPKPQKSRDDKLILRRHPSESGVEVKQKGGRVILEFNENLSDDALRAAFQQYLEIRRG